MTLFPTVTSAGAAFVVPVGTLVRRHNETEWHALTSSERERIVTEWNVLGPDGLVPVVCSP